MKRLTNSARRSLARGPCAPKKSRSEPSPPGHNHSPEGGRRHSARRIAQNIAKKKTTFSAMGSPRAPDLVRSMSGEVSRDQAEVEKAHARPLNLNSLDHYVPRKMLTVRNRPRTKGASYLVLGRLRGRVLT